MSNIFNFQNKIFTFFIVLTLFITFSFLFFNLKSNVKKISGSDTHPYVILKNEKFKIEVADKYESQVQGLSDRKELRERSGMLFDFGDKMQRNFWMKNMHFPIDIIWIEDDEVVNISKNCQPEGERPKKHYQSLFPVNYVLEVNAGVSDKLGLKSGDRIKIYK
jgi:uncharacterized membrane protein (UPF0127 family)